MRIRFLWSAASIAAFVWLFDFWWAAGCPKRKKSKAAMLAALQRKRKHPGCSQSTLERKNSCYPPCFASTWQNRPNRLPASISPREPADDDSFFPLFELAGEWLPGAARAG